MPSDPILVFEKYAVIRRLAIGGMGEIFLARQTGVAGFQRLAILKSLRPELAEEEGFLAQFLNEARVAATLNHPNIVAIYEVGLFQGVYFIAMEYINGVDLTDLIRSSVKVKKRIPTRVAISIVKDAAMGLDHAHAARDEQYRPLDVVHRDVSPQNVMVRLDGVVKVVDFGIAKAANQLHSSTGKGVQGKVSYMSPEQIASRPLDGRSDQFSLGVVFWELCTQRRLFKDDNPVAVMKRILSGDVVPPSQFNPRLPPELDRVVMRMLATDREKRFDRAGEVAAALRAVLDSTGGGSAEEEVSAFVNALAGKKVADRVRDLSPAVTSIAGLSALDENVCSACHHRNLRKAKFCGECGAPLSAPGGSGAEAESSASGGSPVVSSSDSAAVVNRGTSGSQLSSGNLWTADSVPQKPPDSPAHPQAALLSPAGIRPASMPPPDATQRAPAPAMPVAEVEVEVNLGTATEPSPMMSVLADRAALIARSVSGERRPVVALAGRLSGRDRVRERLGAAVAGAVDARLLQEIQHLADEHDAWVGSLSPEELLFVFGAERASPDDAIRAVDCAGRLGRLLAGLGGELSGVYSIAVGIEHGTALVSGGGQRRMTVEGDVITAAKRLAESARSSGAPTQLGLGMEQLLRVVSAAPATDLLPLDGAPPTEIAPAPLLARVRARAPSRARELTGPGAPVVRPLAGRSSELRSAIGVLTKAKARMVSPVLLFGEPGIGKSRLLAEVELLAARSGFSAVSLRAERSEAIASGALARRLVRGVLGALGGEAARSSGLSGDRARNAVLESLDPVLAPQISTLFGGLPTGGELMVEDRLRVEAAAARIFLLAAARTPICLVIDDLHLADWGSVELLRRVGQRTDSAALAIVASSRSDVRAKLGLGWDSLELMPLEHAAILEIAGTELGGARLPEPAVPILLSSSGGNPMLALEITRALIDRGGIAPKDGAWIATPGLASLELPKDLGRFLEARIDRLSEPSRAFLRTGALMGQSFSIAVATEVLIGPNPGVDRLELSAPIVAECLASGLLVRSSNAPLEIVELSPALVRDVILGRMVEKDRSRLHAEIAHGFVRAAGPGAAVDGKTAEQIARHLLAAGATKDVGPWAEKAADWLASTGSYESAALYYRRALEATQASLARTRIDEPVAKTIFGLVTRASAVVGIQNPVEGAELLSPFLAKIPRMLAPNERAEAIRRRALLSVKRGHLTDARADLEQALADLATHGAVEDPETRAKLLATLAQVLEGLGRARECAAQLAQAFHVMGGRAPRDPSFYWEQLNALGRHHLRLGELAEARELFSQASQQASYVNSLEGQSRALTNLAAVSASERKIDEALGRLEQARSFAERAFDPVGLARIHYNRGRVLLDAGRRVEGRAALEEAAKIAREVGWKEGEALSRQALEPLRGSVPA